MSCGGMEFVAYLRGIETIPPPVGVQIRPGAFVAYLRGIETAAFTRWLHEHTVEVCSLPTRD